MRNDVCTSGGIEFFTGRLPMETNIFVPIQITTTIIIIIIRHVLIKVTLSCQRHCRGTAQSLTSKKEQAEALIAGGRRQAIVAV